MSNKYDENYKFCGTCIYRTKSKLATVCKDCFGTVEKQNHDTGVFNQIEQHAK